MSRPSLFSLQRLGKALLYSLAGLKAAWQHEAAFRLEVVLAAILIPLACYIDVSKLERLSLIGTVLLVLLAELINSAIERVVDLASPKKHDLAKQAKDIGSAVVLVALILAAAVWGVILSN